ncbi:MAG: hypothetical protein KC994_14870, partial [Candidatus Omnitrophica bacterium]|nr:hypothetical protein [Candidatus Omnitrophota bacterium]
MNKRTWIVRFVILSAILVCLLLWRHEKVEQAVVKTVEKVQEVRTRGTVQDRLDQYGESARERFLPYFEQAEVNYPPPSLTFIGLKSEKTLQ